MRQSSSSPARRYNTARSALVFVIAMTVVNFILYLAGSDRYYICSVFLAYTLFEPTLLGIVLPLLILAPYVLAYIFSKKKSGWLIAALVLYILDTLFVLLMALLFFSVSEKLGVFNAGVELLVHVVVVVLLILGLKGRKIATMSDEELLAANTAAGAAAAAAEGGRNALAGTFPEISCTLSVSPDGKPNPLLNPGFIRFRPEEIQLAAQTLGGQMLVGSLLAAEKEAARFAYANVTGARFTNKRETAVELRLNDGGVVSLILSGRTDRDRFVKLMGLHGIRVQPGV